MDGLRVRVDGFRARVDRFRARDLERMDSGSSGWIQSQTDYLRGRNEYLNHSRVPNKSGDPVVLPHAQFERLRYSRYNWQAPQVGAVRGNESINMSILNMCVCNVS